MYRVPTSVKILYDFIFCFCVVNFSSKSVDLRLETAHNGCQLKLVEEVKSDCFVPTVDDSSRNSFLSHTTPLAHLRALCLSFRGLSI
jgi:hypothetical protein